LYLQYLVVLTQVAVGWCHGWGGTCSSPAGSDIAEYYQILSSAPDDGRRHRPKHVELTTSNKLTYIVATCWLLS